MNIDCCLITAAGLGTRMKDIGKVLPKILWPVFEKRLIDMQVAYAETLGARRIFINTHFLHKEVEEYVRTHHLNVETVHEDPILDVGGAIYNVARILEFKEKKLIVLNGDQFLFFNRDLLELKDGYDGVLFGIKVKKNSGYRETVIKNDQLVAINEAGIQQDDYQTYSGVSIFDISRIEKKSGVLPFFDSIANYKTRKIQFCALEDYEYFDFGTTERYADSIRRIVHGDSLMKKFLIENDGYDPEKNYEQDGVIVSGDIKVKDDGFIYQGRSYPF